MKLSEAVFPVYRLLNSKPSNIDNVIFYAKVNSKGEEVAEVVDDKNISGPTLSSRRLHIKNPFIIKEAIFYYGDLLKIAKKGVWFIDSKGALFTIEKTRTVPIIYKKIRNVERIVGATIIEVEDLPGRYMSLFPPEREEEYAAMLKIANHSYLLYGFSTHIHKNIHRKI
jgi:hypothetical protein